MVSSANFEVHARTLLHGFTLDLMQEHYFCTFIFIHIPYNRHTDVYFILTTTGL